MKFIQILWERGLGGLYEIDFNRKGIVFNCFEVYTTVKISGFECYRHPSENINIVDDDTKQWEVFVPFGETAELEWYGQWNVGIVSTPYGPLEIYSEWLGGGKNNYRAVYTMPDGYREEIEENESHLLTDNVLAAWVAAYPKINFGDKWVNFI